MGYAEAGFRVVGVDIVDQPHYPFEFCRANALRFSVAGFDVVHASPPCEPHANTRCLGDRTRDIIPAIREKLQASGLPYVIENVQFAPLVDPVLLCGRMFPELRVYRHRIFETNWSLSAPKHPKHEGPVARLGARPRPGEFMHVVGNFTGVKYAREAMGIDWMTRNELAEAIPPAYTRFIGKQLKEHLNGSSSRTRS